MIAVEARADWHALGRALRAEHDAMRREGRWPWRRQRSFGHGVVTEADGAAIISLTAFHATWPVRRLLGQGGRRRPADVRAAIAWLMATRHDASPHSVARHLGCSLSLAQILIRKGEGLRASCDDFVALTDRVVADLDAEGGE